MEKTIDQTLKARIKTDLFAILWKLQIQVSPEDFMRPLNHMGVDSLDYVELILSIEHHFKIQLTNEEMNPHCTVNDMLELIEQKLTLQQP